MYVILLKASNLFRPHWLYLHLVCIAAPRIYKVSVVFNSKDSSFDSEGFGEIAFKNELIARNQTNAKKTKPNVNWIRLFVIVVGVVAEHLRIFFYIHICIIFFFKQS